MKKLKLFVTVLCFLIFGSFLYHQKQASDCVNQRREVIEAIFSGRGYMFADTEDITEAFIADYANAYAEGDLLSIARAMEKLEPDGLSIIYQ